MNSGSDKRQKSLAAAVGTFDGVHCGHRSLLARLRRSASERDMEPAVVTFDRHPLETLRPGRVPSSLSTPALKERLLRDNDVANILTLDFNRELADMTAAEFLEMLRSRYDVRHLVLGFNTSMGRDRISDLADFQRIAVQAGMTVERAAELGHGISSSAIRRALTAGDVSLAAEMLGRPYRLEGIVVHGRQLGRKLGWPTANLAPEPVGQTVPASGVYACVARVDGDDTPVPAMVNIGRRPTVDDGDAPVTIEAHLLDFDGDLYGRLVTLDFIARLRDERRFADLDSLAAQLRDDAAMARAAVANETEGPSGAL